MIVLPTCHLQISGTEPKKMDPAPISGRYMGWLKIVPQISMVLKLIFNIKMPICGYSLLYLGMFSCFRSAKASPELFHICGLIPNSAEAVGVTAILPTEQREGPLDWFQGKSTGNSSCFSMLFKAKYLGFRASYS